MGLIPRIRADGGLGGADGLAPEAARDNRALIRRPQARAIRR